MKSIDIKFLEDLINNKKYKEIREMFELYPEIDIADTCNQIEDVSELITIFRIVKSEYTAELFSHLDQEKQENLIKAMSDKEVATLIENSSNDDIADFLEEMPANLVKKVLSNSSKEDRTLINKLLNYKDDTAGSIMTTEYLEFLDSITVKDAINLVREKGRSAETIYTIFVTDEKRNFLGTVDLDDLIFAQSNEILNDIMNKDFVTVEVNTDQEEVAQLARRYDLNSIAVLNDDKRLCGIITIDDIVDVIQEEANEDLTLQAGLTPLEDSYKETGVFKMAFKCIPWLGFLLIIGVFSSMILSKFQVALAQIAILSAFLPTILDTSGNAGSQTSALMVRSIALNEFQLKDYFKVLWKEIRISLIVSLFVSIIAFAWFLTEMYLNLVTYPTVTEGFTEWQIFEARAAISLLVAITLSITIIISKILGCTLTFLAKAIKKDPALISGPLLTSIVDITSLLIYFAVLEIIGKFLNII